MSKDKQGNLNIETFLIKPRPSLRGGLGPLDESVHMKALCIARLAGE
jgi:hypothetical protein